MRFSLPHRWSTLSFSVDIPLKITQALELYLLPFTGFTGDKAQTLCRDPIFLEISWTTGKYERPIPTLQTKKCCTWNRVHFTLN